MRLFLTAALAALAPASAFADTLGDALASAYKTNPTLDGARQVTRQADEGFAQARAGFLPQVGITGSYGTQLRITETETIFGTQRSKNTSEPQNATITATQSLFEGGRRLAQIGQANAQIESAQEGLRSTEQQVLLQVIAVYVDVRRDEEVVRIRENNVTLLERQLQAAKDRFEVGEITRTDVAQAQARLSGAQAGLAGARSDLAASRAEYTRIVGQAPGMLEVAPPVAGLPDNLDDAVTIALDLNPDLLRFKQNERAARQQVRIERADLLPQISVFGRMARDIEPSGPGIEQESQVAAAQVSIPLFEGGFARSRTRSARVGVLRAQAQTEEVRRSVVSQTTSAWNDYAAAQRVIEASKEQFRANELALEGVEQEQQVGLRTTLDVLNAQQELLDSQLSVIRAERDAYVAAHGLLLSIGKLDARSLNVNAPLYDPDDHRRAVRWTILSTRPADDR
ncbi:MAG: TolC family outer membrane protein [Hyphomonadaceae bacterium]|nr:MAG: outer membrane channel protein [Caulobacteraceae bacterium]MBT9444891.1 TolC family outer membrane protein [Hyphomonadaceae bacterium]TPW01820.1 MAG: outer membrane channel protein [Alphaproteobacteria bacterium]